MTRFRAFVALFVMALVLAAGGPVGAQEGPDNVEGNGTVAIAAALCDVAGADPTGCAAETVTGITISDAQFNTWTEADASLHGANYVWELPFNTYYVNFASLAPPVEGYVFDRITGADPTDTGAMFGLPADDPNRYIYVVFALEQTEPVDSDGDGLSDGLEADLGTDPADTDSDDDGYDDGTEYDAGTDPLDAQSFPGPAPAEGSTLQVDALVCPTEYAGNNYVEDCPGTEGILVDISLVGSEFADSAETGANGSAIFPGLGEGNFTIELGVPGDFANFQTVCGTPESFEPRQHENQNTNRITVYLGPSESLTCTFFVIGVDAKGDTDDEPADEPSEPETVTKLPDTGVRAGARNDAAIATGGLAVLAVVALVALSSAAALRRRTA